jgi:hypothetical protein
MTEISFFFSMLYFKFIFFDILGIDAEALAKGTIGFSGECLDINILYFLIYM